MTSTSLTIGTFDIVSSITYSSRYSSDTEKTKYTKWAWYERMNENTTISKLIELCHNGVHVYLAWFVVLIFLVTI